jgi:hypothetical protein
VRRQGENRDRIGRCANQHGAAIANRQTGLSPAPPSAKDIIMLYTIAVILLVLWLLGVVSSYTIGGFIHILLVVAIVMVLLRLISGRNV